MISVSVVAVSSARSPLGKISSETAVCFGNVVRDFNRRHDGKTPGMPMWMARHQFAAGSRRGGLPDRGRECAPARARRGTDRRHHGHLGPTT
jgi:hypothetical protein